MAQSKPQQPLALNDLLIQNVNTWGNVQFNIPLRLSNTETRTSTSIGLRQIPAISHSLDCVKGFGPRHKEIWMPLTAKVHRGVYDRIHVKKEYKEVSASHNPVKNLKGAFISETMKKYKTPFAISSLASWDHGEVFDLAPFPPNPYQTNIAPFMYCSDYCHIAQGTPPYTVIDQFAHNLPPHKKCVKRFIVSSDY
ncbi:hypothetical protein HF086_009841 [Spodoptera exigua]|uniref:Uncharacterized protein n=1 Tax=Spodoptera exigua TaxID=7107 RepID=A0A922MX81_SPOEX|nr:hypothetical protein HF086_009841 [Spodoptera exigua]